MVFLLVKGLPDCSTDRSTVPLASLEGSSETTTVPPVVEHASSVTAQPGSMAGHGFMSG